MQKLSKVKIARGKESLENKKQRAALIVRQLKRAYPDATIALEHHTPLQLLIATILSAQCTDKRVNMVTPALFARYKTAEDFASAKRAELESLIQSTGFYRAKAKNIIGSAQALVREYGGLVPNSMDELLKLRGVGRKTANVVLGAAFNKSVGIVVDTHVKRLSERLAFTSHHDPVKIEHDLMELFPQKIWILLPHLLIHHGRKICAARKPKCSLCPIQDLCPSKKKFVGI